MASRRSRYLQALRRRVKFLRKRLDDRGDPPKEGDFDHAEATALEWAIDQLGRVHAGVVDDNDRTLAKAALGELGEVTSAVESVASAFARMRRQLWSDSK